MSKEGWGEKKTKRAWDDEKGKERKRGLFPLPIVPRALAIFFFFDYYYISYWDTKWQPLRRRASPSQDSPAKFISFPQASIVSRNKERESRNQSTDAKRRNRERL